MREQLLRLQTLLRERQLDAYIVPTADFHGSEYVGEHFKAREYLSGFTGSSGTLLVTQESAGLWTDGRYFLQAEQELTGSGITLFKMDLPGVPTLTEYLFEHLPPHANIGFDGRTVDAAWGLTLLDALKEKQVRFQYTLDLAGELWEQRPPLSQKPVIILEDVYAGESAADKLARLRKEMQAYDASVHVLCALDDIAWLFNLRGTDVDYNPVFLGYAIIEEANTYLFSDKEKFSSDVLDYLKGLGVTLCPYAAIYEHITGYAEGTPLLMSLESSNYTLYRLANERCNMIDRPNPTAMMKAVKNPQQIQHLRRAHIRDGLAMVRFLYWLKTNIRKKGITELDAAKKLDALRTQEACCTGLSFETISAYGAHGAIVHYGVDEFSNIPLRPEGFYLVDSGGQYYEGTTDVTRTVALGPLSAQQKRDFTMVLKGMLQLANASFPEGICGYHLDILARQFLWEEGLDYRHGTGHGIGSYLCVHEGPVNIRWRQKAPQNAPVLQAGMVLSDEPGLYREGEYGIRLENQLVCKELKTTEYGRFLGFETLTLVPIDLDAIDASLLTQTEKSLLDLYHARVYDILSTLLTKEEAAWLKKATRPIAHFVK